MNDSAGNDSQFRDAREFVEDVRGRLALGMRTLKGRPGLPTAQRLVIRATAVSFVVAGRPPPISQAEATRLLERFEEMARREKMIIDAGLRPYILGHLVTELWTNKHSLDMEPEKLLAATAYHGAIGVKLPQEFPQFSETPGLFRYAVTNYPGAPQDFLRKAAVMMVDISREKEFAEFSDTPGIFKQAVVRNPSNPRKFLRTVQSIISAMANEEEFAEFRRVPGIFKLAAISNPSGPGDYLRKVKKIVSEIAGDPEFSCFSKTPGIFLQAVVRNPSDPRGLLKRIKTDIKSMAKEKEFAEFFDNPHILQYAALHNTSNPRGFLRSSPKELWHAMLVKGRKALAKEGSAKNPKKQKSPKSPGK